jgi:hypothetical protein
LSKNKPVLLLLAAVVLLGGYLAWDFRQEKTQQEKKTKQSFIFGFAPDQVNEVIIENDKQKTVIVKTVDGWMLESPIKDLADNFYTDDFVSRAMKDQWLDVAKEGADVEWKVYGLDKPAGKVSFKSQATQEIKTLEVSLKQNFELNSIARLSGDHRVLIVPSSWGTHISRGPQDFRDKRLFRNKIGAVDQLEFKFGSRQSSYTLSRQDGNWQNVQNPAWILDQNLVREVLSHLAESRVQEHDIKLNPGKFEFSVIASMADKKWQVQGEQLVKIEKALLDKFKSFSLASLRDKKIPFNFDLQLVRKLHIETPVKQIKLSKSANQWTHAEDKINSSAVQELVEDIKKTQAVRYSVGALENAMIMTSRLSLFDEADKVLLKLEWGEAMTGEIDGRPAKLIVMKSNLSKDLFLVEDVTLNKWTSTEFVKTTESAK